MSIMKLIVSVSHEVEGHVNLHCTAYSETNTKQLVLCSRFWMPNRLTWLIFQTHSVMLLKRCSLFVCCVTRSLSGQSCKIKLTWCTTCNEVYFVNLNMFRAYLGPSSRGKTVCIKQLILIIIFRWLSAVRWTTDSWFFLHNYIELQGKQNIKNKLFR